MIQRGTFIRRAEVAAAMAGWGGLFGLVIGLPCCGVLSTHYLSVGNSWGSVLAAFVALPAYGLVFGLLFAAPVGAWLLWDRPTIKAGPLFVGPAFLITLIGLFTMPAWPLGAWYVAGLACCATVGSALVVRRLLPRLTIYDGRCPGCLFDNRSKGLKQCPRCGFDFASAHTGCTVCAYDLRGLEAAVCPECGSRIVRWTRPFKDPAPEPDPAPYRSDLWD